MVLGVAAVHFVGFIGNRINGVGGINSHAALDAPSHFAAQKPCHVLLLVQVLRVLMHMGEPVDGMAGQMGRCRQQLGIFGFGCLVIGRADGVEAIHLDFVHPVYLFAVQVDIAAHPPQAFDILLFCSHELPSLPYFSLQEALPPYAAVEKAPTFSCLDHPPAEIHCSAILKKDSSNSGRPL